MSAPHPAPVSTPDRIGATGEGPHGGLLLVGVFEEEPPAAEALPAAIADVLRSLGERPGWKGRDGQVAEEDNDDGQCRPGEDHGRQ